MKKPIKSSLHVPNFRNVWVRQELKRTTGRKFRVLIYARYSTDEQNPRSIEDQILYCTQFLESLGLKPGDYEVTVLSDEGISGEIIRRPGIDAVWDGIKDRLWELVVSEDSGRPYRDAAVCINLVRQAVDQKIRVLFINDEVDTSDADNWEDRLHEAAHHHQKANRYTSRRIKRAHEALWAMGAAIGLLKPGYLRKPTKPAANGEPEEGPFFDFIDPEKAGTISEIYERIAAQESPASVADWLTLIGFAKTGNAQKKAWTDRNVIDLIRRTDYRGLQRYRDTVAKKNYRTGARRGEPSADDQKLTRDMPHLRIVPDGLWNKANQAINERCTVHDVPSGVDHCLYGVPRDSRGALSQVFQCGICKNPMHKEGRAEGGYRCSRAGRECWNKATCLSKETEAPIYTAVIQRLKSLDTEIDRLLQHTAALAGNATIREVRKAELITRKTELQAAVNSLNDALEEVSEKPVSTLARLAEREADLAEVCGELEEISQDDVNKRPPTRKEIDERIVKMITSLSAVDRKSRDDLMVLAGTIEAVPHVQFGTNKVVLRARFEIRLAALLPARTRASLVGLHGKLDDLGFERPAVTVNLFKPSTGPEHGLNAVALKAQGLGLTAIGKALGITKRKANLATQYGEAMLAAGITEPFQELTSPPEKASRWRKRKRNKDDDERAA